MPTILPNVILLLSCLWNVFTETITIIITKQVWGEYYVTRCTKRFSVTSFCFKASGISQLGRYFCEL